MRDWISEMSVHRERVESEIKSGNNDEAWRLAHEYQSWCFERINKEKHDLEYSGTLLSSVQTFLSKILESEKKYNLSLCHKIYEGVLDGRNLKYYPKKIKVIFNKCKFDTTKSEVALKFYDDLKSKGFGIKRDFREIVAVVESWQ